MGGGREGVEHKKGIGLEQAVSGGIGDCSLGKFPANGGPPDAVTDGLAAAHARQQSRFTFSPVDCEHRIDAVPFHHPRAKAAWCKSSNFVPGLQRLTAESGIDTGADAHQGRDGSRDKGKVCCRGKGDQSGVEEQQENDEGFSHRCLLTQANKMPARLAVTGHIHNWCQLDVRHGRGQVLHGERGNAVVCCYPGNSGCRGQKCGLSAWHKKKHNGADLPDSCACKDLHYYPTRRGRHHGTKNI